MLQRIDADQLTLTLRRLLGRTAYLHVEVTPGGFLRNVTINIADVVLRSDGATYRVALRAPADGWVVMEGLTHMSNQAGQPLMLCALAEEDRLTRVIQISEEAFAA